MAADSPCQASARCARFFSQRGKRRSAGLSENAARHGGNSLLHEVVVQLHQELSQRVVLRQCKGFFHLLLCVPVLLLPGRRLPGMICPLRCVLLRAGRKRPCRLLAYPHGRAHGVLRRRHAAQANGCQCLWQLLRPLLCCRLRALPRDLRVNDLLARIHIKNCVVLLPGRALHGVARAQRREDLLLTKEEQEAVYIMRRALNGMKSEEAVENILNMFVHTKDNQELVARVRRQKYV